MRNRRATWWIFRFFTLAVVVFLTLTITFFLMHMIPGDPFSATIENLPNDVRQRYLTQYGFDKPVLEQYVIFLKRLLIQGDFGVSLRSHGQTVGSIIKNTMPTSVIIGSLSLLIGTGIGYALGILAAYTSLPLLKELISTVSILGISLPVYILAPFLQNQLSVRHQLFYVSGWGRWNHIILPVVSMMPLTIASVLKYTKGSIERVRRTGYYIAAKQRGFSETHIFLHHVLKNSSPPVITIIVSSISAVFSGSFVAEKIFSIPGIGRQFMNAVSARDYTVIIGLNVVFTGIYAAFMLLGDILQELLNPLFES